MIITVDGPSASGKSTLARLLADRLGMYFVSTGALYRALAYITVNLDHYKESDFASLTDAQVASYLHDKDFIYSYTKDRGAQIMYKGIDITPQLKTPTIDYLASKISIYKPVRTELIHYQRNLARTHDIVMEGRDIGSVVFPDADIKIFLTASLEERARRWQRDQEQKGHHYSLQQCMQQIDERDSRDKDRTLSPLVIPEGAIVIDDTNLTKEETLQQLLEQVQKYRNISS